MTIEIGSSGHRSLTPRRQHPGFDSASQGQLDALYKFTNDKRIPAPIAYGIKTYMDRGQMTFDVASETLGMLIDYVNKPAPDPVKEMGIYVHPRTDIFYLVKASKHQRLYAMVLKILNEGERNPDGTWKHKPVFTWEFKSGAVMEIQAGWKATPEQLKQWGDIWGLCVKCLSELTRQDSIERGMGLKCWKKQFG